MKWVISIEIGIIIIFLVSDPEGVKLSKTKNYANTR